MRRSTIATVGALAATATLAGCGAGTNNAGHAPAGARPLGHTPLTGAQALEAAYTTTTKAGSARMLITSSLDGKPLLKGSGLVSLTQDDAAETMSIRGQKITLRTIGKRIYVQVPSAERAQLGGKQWAETNLASLLGKNKLASSGTGSFNGQQTLSMLRKVSGTVTRVGTKSLDGTTVTEYRMPLDLSTALRQEGLSPQQAKTAGKTHIANTVPVTVDIDPQGRTREIGMTLKLGSHTIGEAVQFEDFGVPVHVTAPPASQTANLTKQLKKQDKQQA